MPVERFIELATSEGRRVLDVIFRHASEAVTVQERSGRLIYVNDAAAAMVGYSTGDEMLAAPIEEIRGRFEIVDETGKVVVPDALPGRRVLKGEPFVEEVVGYRRRGSSGIRWSRVRASPVKNNAGEVILAINYFLDITAAKQREEHRRLLSTAFEALGLSLDFRLNLEKLAGVIVPAFGEWCLVHLLEGEALTLSAYASPAEKVVEAEESGPQAIPLAGERLQSRVARLRAPETLTNVTSEMLPQARARFGDRFAGSASAVVNALCVPMTIGERTVGTITVIRSGDGLAFDEPDIEALMAIADRAATVIENTRLYEKEHEIANTLRRGLISPNLPEIPGLHLEASYRPFAYLGQVGGDFYDEIQIDADRWALAVGDIAGKGVRAAAAVSLARYTIRATAAMDPMPRTVLRQLNRALLDDEPDRMCTIAYGLIERRGSLWSLKLALAGHPPPALLRNSDVQFLGRPSPPVGILSDLDPFDEEYELLSDDLLVVYTDGYSLTGLTPPESVDLALRNKVFSSTNAALEELTKHLEAEPNIRDDVVLLAAQVT
jgi:PAS domain S-box-containing protein